MTDPWLDPLLVANRRLRFEHSAEDVAAARDLIGAIEAPDDRSRARAIVMRVHERMRVLPSAFGFGMPKTLRAIVSARGGNCVSHAVLATVLLRANSIPTRLVVEDVYTNVALIRAPAAFLPAAIGPTLNGHVWIEVCVDGAWVPADAELGILGMVEWLSARLGHGVTVAALGLVVREHWKFPLRIRRLGPDGAPEEDVTGRYLIDGPFSALGPAAGLPSAWVEGVRYFAESFPWQGRAGLRILREGWRLREMSRALATFAGALRMPATPQLQRRK